MLLDGDPQLRARGTRRAAARPPRGRPTRPARAARPWSCRHRRAVRRPSRARARAGRRARSAAPRSRAGRRAGRRAGSRRAVKPGGHRDGGLAGVVERAGVGREADHADERPAARAAVVLAHARRAAGEHRRQHDVGVRRRSRFRRSASAAALRRRRRPRARAGIAVPIRARPRGAAREPVAVADLDAPCRRCPRTKRVSTRLPIVRPQSNSRSTHVVAELAQQRGGRSRRRRAAPRRAARRSAGARSRSRSAACPAACWRPR